MDRPTPGSTTPRRRLHLLHDRTAGCDVSGSGTAPSPARRVISQVWQQRTNVLARSNKTRTGVRRLQSDPQRAAQRPILGAKGKNPMKAVGGAKIVNWTMKAIKIV